MGDSVILPNNILRSQVCQECFGYLSVGPVTMNDKGEPICGRCNIDQPELQTKSFYMVLAQGFKFKCTNHLNGCNEVLFPVEMENHEQNCIYKTQDCFFCSFSGNLSQIVNHSSQCHPENVSFDGGFMFSLSDVELNKTLLYLLDNNLYSIGICINEEVIKISIHLTNGKVTANHFVIKFFNSQDPSDSEFVLTDYGLFHDKFPSYFEKSMEHLIISFGFDTTLCCQLLVDEVKLMDEIRKCYAIMRQAEKQNAELQSRGNSYKVAIDIIKIMSRVFYRCMLCLKMCTVDLYLCDNFHVYCQKCVTSTCHGCNKVMEYKNVTELEYFKFKVPCDYADCNKTVKISNYLDHRQDCSKRPYYCPLKNCDEIVLSAKGLREHWHSDIPKLHFRKIIEIKQFKTEEFYWMIKSDLYQIHVNFSQKHISVLIDEINVLKNDKMVFKCHGFQLFGAQRWNNIPMTDFCGKPHINCVNRFSVRGVALSSLSMHKYTQIRIIAYV